MEKLKGKELETLVLFRAGKLEECRILTMGRYGVQAVMMNDEQGIPRWQVIPSLPDLEGVAFGTGRQIVIECKVTSQSSYPVWSSRKKQPKQINHMLKRSEFGALCFLLLHFNERVLSNKTYAAITYAIPVNHDSRLWDDIDTCASKSITRQDAELYGIVVPWNLYSHRASKLTPDLSVLLPPAPADNLTLETERLHETFSQ